VHALVLAALIALQDTTPRPTPPTPPVPAVAFADTGTANLVQRARAHRTRAERLVTSYVATVNQRMGVGVRALRRDRMVFNQQMTARIIWRRDSTSTIEMTGARQAMPIAIAGVHIPQALTEQASILAFDPSEDYLRLIGNDPEGMLYPLADSAERFYRYEPGDTTTITLPSGREIRLVEVKVTAPRPSFRFLNGSLWFDADSWGLVRMLVRPSRSFDLELDGDSGDAEDVPGIFKPVTFDIQFITFEYGLYETRWWLPRLMAFDGELSMGSFLRAPARFERVYAIERVAGGGEPPPPTPQRWRAGARGPNIDSIVKADSVRLAPDSIGAIVATCVARDSAQLREARARRDSLRQQRRRGARVGVTVDVRIGVGTCIRRTILEARGQPWRSDLTVVLPPDTMSLLTSVDLGPPILDMGDVINADDLRQLEDAIGGLPGEPWQFRRVIGVAGLRYNRVEALSGGVRGTLDFGKLRLGAQARIGLADLEPNGEIALDRPARGLALRAAAYRRLAVVDPPTPALGIGNSLNALLFGRDDGDYFRTLGIEAVAAPGSAHARWIEGRVFVERQRPAATATDVSLVRLFDDTRRFRPTIAALPAGQAGAALTLRGFHTFASQLGVGADLFVEGQTGTAEFARSALTLRGTLPVVGLVAGLEAAAGTSTGPVTPQALWYLGGPQTLRGYSGNVMNGEAFWRGRGELTAGFPMVRLAFFSDAGWAGRNAAWGTGRPLVSVGMGLSFLDGLFRLDVSQALRAPRGWRLDLYADGVL
jgi:hypothetical protein